MNLAQIGSYGKRDAYPAGLWRTIKDVRVISERALTIFGYHGSFDSG
jgi:hypothetical protein